MPKDFIPSTDAGKRTWGLNYKTLITATPTAYGLTAGQATAYGALFDAYDAALTIASDPSTRTSSATLAKNIARAEFVASARELARIVQATPSVTDEQKNDLGLTVRDTQHTTIGRPTSKPVTMVEDIQNLMHVLRLRDASTPSTNAKPFGAIAGEVYAKIGGESEPLSISECKFMGLATRIPHVVQFAPEDANKTVWYLCRWVNARGEAGPLSDQISATIAA